MAWEICSAHDSAAQCIWSLSGRRVAERSAACHLAAHVYAIKWTHGHPCHGCRGVMQDQVLYGSAKRSRSGGSGATIVFDSDAVCYSECASAHLAGIAAPGWNGRRPMSLARSQMGEPWPGSHWASAVRGAECQLHRTGRTVQGSSTASHERR